MPTVLVHDLPSNRQRELQYRKSLQVVPLKLDSIVAIRAAVRSADLQVELVALDSLAQESVSDWSFSRGL